MSPVIPTREPVATALSSSGDRWKPESVTFRVTRMMTAEGHTTWQTRGLTLDFEPENTITGYRELCKSETGRPTQVGCCV